MDQAKEMAKIAFEALEDKKGEEAGYAAKETEGHRSGAWVLIDFGDVIVHIFDRENRQFYNLERIWNDGKRIDDVNEL